MRLGILDPMLKADIGSGGNFGNWSNLLALHLSQKIRNNPIDGISEHLHIFTIKRGKFLFNKSDYTMFPPGEKPVKIEMPPVARSFSEFESMLKISCNADVAGAIC